MTHLDLDELERIAKAAESDAPWRSYVGMTVLSLNGRYVPGTETEAHFIAALNPTTALELIRLARLGRAYQGHHESFGRRDQLIALGQWAETHGVEALESIQNTPECDSTLKINHKNHWTIFAKRKARDALAALPKDTA